MECQHPDSTEWRALITAMQMLQDSIKEVQKARIICRIPMTRSRPVACCRDAKEQSKPLMRKSGLNVRTAQHRVSAVACGALNAATTVGYLIGTDRAYA
jgi:hypothetical protein